MSNLNDEIKTAIDSLEMDRARTLLREALREPDAETYYLASLVAINDDQKEEFLKKALQLDPLHPKARIAFTKLERPSATSPATLSQVPGISAEEFENSLARQKSFIGPAIITFVLTLFFWIPGLIANILYLREARRTQARAGQGLAGVGCLWALLIINAIIPLSAIGFLAVSLRPVPLSDNNAKVVASDAYIPPTALTNDKAIEDQNNNAKTATSNAFIPPAALTNYKDIQDQKLIGTTPEGYPYMGAENAPVLLEEMGSLSCIVCQNYHNAVTLNLLDEVLAGRLKYVFIPVVTTGEFDPTQITRAALAAHQQGKFWDYQDIAFDWQTRYQAQSNDPAMLDVAARALGLDLTKFHSDMNSSAIKDILDKGEAAFEGRALPKGQIGTPTVFLDGVQIQPALDNQNSPNLSELRGLIEQRAAAKKQ